LTVLNAFDSNGAGRDMLLRSRAYRTLGANVARSGWGEAGIGNGRQAVGLLNISRRIKVTPPITQASNLKADKVI
jgi:hypothetical protein